MLFLPAKDEVEREEKTTQEMRGDPLSKVSGADDGPARRHIVLVDLGTYYSCRDAASS
jgi:hypothetical protein